MSTSNNVDEAFRQFTTTVAFITTHGSRGPNVMAAEWTFNGCLLNVECRLIHRIPMDERSP